MKVAVDCFFTPWFEAIVLLGILECQENQGRTQSFGVRFCLPFISTPADGHVFMKRFEKNEKSLFPCFSFCWPKFQTSIQFSLSIVEKDLSPKFTPPIITTPCYKGL